MKLLVKSFIISCVLLLSACGFALHEPPHFADALQNVYINTNSPNDPFVQTLERVLIANHINVTHDREAASAVLHLITIQTSNTISTNNGVDVAGFYTAYLTVKFSLKDNQGNVLIKPTTLQQSQNFTSNVTQVLSGNLLAAQLASQMNQALAEAIVNQLARISS